MRVCFLCPGTEWKLEISEKVQRMGTNFPPSSSQQCCFLPQKKYVQKREKVPEHPISALSGILLHSGF